MRLKRQIKHSDIEKKRLEYFQELFFKYHSRLVLFANKFTCDIQVSQDLVQDAFLKLWENTEDLVSIESPLDYLFQAVRNNCLNNKRHVAIGHTVKEELSHKLNTLEKAAYLGIHDPLYSLFEKELEQKVEELIRSMPDKCRRVFIMSRREYLKNKQIAEQLDISEKMVEKHISKALSILRTGLSGHLGVVFFIITQKKLN